MDNERALTLICNLITMLQDQGLDEEEIFEEIGMSEDEIDEYYYFLDDEDDDDLDY